MLNKNNIQPARICVHANTFLQGRKGEGREREGRDGKEGKEGRTELRKK